MTAWPRAVVAGALVAILAGCGAEEPPQLWNLGRLVVGTGDTTGVYYQVGGGYADMITAHVPGYAASTAPTAGASDNLLRLAAGDLDIALCSLDVAIDAINGAGTFADGPLRFRALARIYRNYTHLIVRIDAGITDVPQLVGRRVATGAPGSGTEVVATRLLDAAGLHPDRDVDRQSMTLPEATRAMIDGSVDAMFWSGGLPTVGVAELLDKARDEVRFVPVADLLPELAQRYPDTYRAGTIPAEAYRLSADVPSVAVDNILAVSEMMPAELAQDLTRLIFDYQRQLTIVHPEWRNVDLVIASSTTPVPMHSGAARFFDRSP